jgi:putative ABC transport system permease protein
MSLLKPVHWVFRYILAVVVLSLKQLVAQRGLTLALLLGFLTAASIMMSVPIYADAVYQKVLESQVNPGAEETIGFQRPPFAFLFRYVGSWSGPLAYESTLGLNEYLSGKAAPDLSLPLNLFARYYKTPGMRFFSTEDSNYEGLRQSLGFVSIGTLTDVEEHVIFLEGQMPSAQLVDGNVEIIVNEKFANTLGLQSGEVYTVYERVQTTRGDLRVEIPVRIAGVWKPLKDHDPYWFYNPSEFDTVLLVQPDAFVLHVLPHFNNEVDLALWYLVMDGSHVKSSDVSSVVRRILYTRQRAFNLMPGLRLDISPLDRLYEYQRKSRNLTLFLYSFSLPLLWMILSFISLVSSMAVQQRRSQIATLRSRGATTWQMLGMATVEGSILGLCSLGLGIPGALWIAHLISQTRSFLDFSSGVQLSLRLPQTAWQVGIGVVIFTIAAQIIPVVSASRFTIVTYKQERSRQSRPSWWQRAWLDVLLLIPVGYGIYLLKKPGGNIAGLPNDPFQNPLLLLLPALAIFGFTLFLLRLLPSLMKAIAWLAGHSPGVSLLLAARQLARIGNDYHAPMILLILTLSLSTFTASMAQTLDRFIYDKNYYEIGANLNLDETGELNTEALGSFLAIGPGDVDEEEPDEEEPRWFFLPVSEHLKVPGVQAATRVRRSQALIELPQRVVPGFYMGIDRLDFPKVSFWRDDFSPESLGALMNNLALAGDGVLIPSQLLEEYAFLPGDSITVTVSMYGEPIEMNLRIAGVFDLFPTWDPKDGPLIVGNLDYLYEVAGMEFPYDVWLKTTEMVDYPRIVNDLEKLGIIVLYYRTAEERLNAEQLRPERQGLFGLLSTGFLAISFLTVLGFFLYALFSFRSRYIELGMLRALGLTARQLIAYLAAELVFLLVVGISAGTAFGIGASQLFIPMLQMGSGPEAQIPPFIIHINWLSVSRVYILLGLLLIIALTTLSGLLLRMKIFQAIKMGEVS